MVYEANDSKQKFAFREKVFVQDTPACLTSVEIRDGSNTQSRRQPFKIATRAVFSVKTQFTCAGIARYSYEWKVLKYEGSRDLIRKEVTFMGTKDRNEFLIKQFDLNPNYYIINVNVTLFDERNQSIGEKSAFTLINVVKPNMSVYLQSGTVRHIGKYPLVCAYLSIPFLFLVICKVCAMGIRYLSRLRNISGLQLLRQLLSSGWLVRRQFVLNPAMTHLCLDLTLSGFQPMVCAPPPVAHEDCPGGMRPRAASISYAKLSVK